MKNRLMIATITSLSMSGLAFAQTNPAPAAGPAPAPMPSTSAPNPTAPAATPSGIPGSNTTMSSDTGLKMASTATVALKFVTVKAADFMSSRLVGANVYNNQNESLGEIDDLVIENGKTITGLVVGVGGFLGMGESYVVLDPSTVVLNQKDGTWRAYVDTTKDNLKNAQKFTYTKMKK